MTTQDPSAYDGVPGARPAHIRWTLALERAEVLDRARRLLSPAAEALVADPARRDALHGVWAGHALHPALTDAPIGFWVSASVLDLLGGASSRRAAQRLVAAGLVAAVPTAVTGLAEWARAGVREQRVGVVHAAANTASLVLYAASWRARRRGRHARGAALALAGGLTSGVGAYLGGHLVSARKLSSRHPAFQEATVPLPG